MKTLGRQQRSSRRVLACEIAAAGGEVVECRADEFFAVFADPCEAGRAAGLIK